MSEVKNFFRAFFSAPRPDEITADGYYKTPPIKHSLIERDQEQRESSFVFPYDKPRGGWVNGSRG
jgi:hypothetical protein